MNTDFSSAACPQCHPEVAETTEGPPLASTITLIWIGVPQREWERFDSRSPETLTRFTKRAMQSIRRPAGTAYSRFARDDDD